jgi:hypothetical protein
MLEEEPEGVTPRPKLLVMSSCLLNKKSPRLEEAKERGIIADV